VSRAPRRPTAAATAIGLVLVAAAVRLAVALPALSRSPLLDPDNYLAIARSVAAGEGYRLRGRPTAYRPPLYPLVLAPMAAASGDRAGAGIAALHALLGAGTVALTLLAARRLGLSPSRALVAGAIVALDPVLVAQSRVVMTETLSACLTAAALAALLAPGRSRPFVAGGLLYGVGTLCRPGALPAAGLTALAIAARGPGGWRDRLRAAALFGAAVAVPLLPWAARNARALGEPVLTTTHGGYTLALANNPVYYADVLHGPPGAVWSGPRQDAWWTSLNRATAGRSEPEADRIVRAIAWRTIRDRPADFARAGLGRLGRLWGVAPSAGVYPAALRRATAAWTIPLWVAVAAGLARPALRRWAGLALLAPPLALTAVHAFYWADLRMRAPLVPALALIAAGASRSWSSPGSRVKMDERGSTLHAPASPPSPSPGTRHG
jgi:hypothetical protein